MALEIGSRLGHYEVTALIGEGGMGQVYQATDTKLNRQVALKILPEAFASDPDRLARFQREAQVLASLNHTNIGHIYGIEEAEGAKALVLELVEGPTLADRIAKGPIPLDEALPIAKQIAEALEAAHEAGVIHRDLKPANIKVREDGTVKVLDFGLAKAFQPDASDPNLSQSPTISLTAAATQMGMVIGTAAYMAPEQAKGKAVDKRVDVWAFGAVLFEMLTGRKPFTGDDVSDTLAAVLRADVDLDALPDDTPTTLRRVISACLQKDPRQRVHDVADVRLAMEGAFGNESPRVLETGRSMVHVRYAAASAVLTGLVVGVVFWYVFIPGDSLTRVPSQFGVNLPPSFEFPLASPHPVAISRDGRRLVFAGLSRALQVNQTFVRSLDELNPVLLRGSDVLSDIGGIFLSPNDEWVGFFDLGNSVFKRVRVTGGPPVTVAEVGQGRDLGASWGSDGTIVFATAASPKLMRVPEFGGVPQPLTDPADNETHFQPHFLPDGHAVLFTTSRTQERDWIGVVEIDSGQTHLLLQGSGPQFVTSGHLLFARDAAVWAVGFDPERLETVGDEVPVLERVRMGLDSGPQLSVSDEGTLVYATDHTPAQTLVWIDREGREEPIPGIPPDTYAQVRVSPDGMRLATGGTGDIWLYDVGRKTFTPLTTDRANDRFPLWTVDGERVVFESNRRGRRDVFSAPADGTGQAEQITPKDAGVEFTPDSWSPDGSTLLLTQTPGVIAAMNTKTGMVEALVDTPSAEIEVDAVVSPDGRWMAYVSPVSGDFEIYAERYPDLGGRRQVSVGGAWSPRWAADGTEFFYMTSDGVLFSVAVDNQASEPWGVPERLFEETYLPANGLTRPFDIAPDGRFVVIKPMVANDDSGTEETPDFIVVQDWFEELTRLVPTP